MLQTERTRPNDVPSGGDFPDCYDVSWSQVGRQVTFIYELLRYANHSFLLLLCAKNKERSDNKTNIDLIQHLKFNIQNNFCSTLC